jgi:hypothetical protein
MKRRKIFPSSKLMVGLIAVVGTSSVLSVWADPPRGSVQAAKPIVAEPVVLMQAKLSSSKKVLEGLLRRDFDSIARAAREMKRISKATEWPRQRDDVYEHFSVEFQRQCNQLESQADALNHEGAKFTYLQLTSTCIQCHDYIRDSRRVAGLNHPRNVRPIPSQWPQIETKHR